MIIKQLCEQQFGSWSTSLSFLLKASAAFNCSCGERMLQEYAYSHSNLQVQPPMICRGVITKCVICLESATMNTFHPDAQNLKMKPVDCPLKTQNNYQL